MTTMQPLYAFPETAADKPAPLLMPVEAESFCISSDTGSIHLRCCPLPERHGLSAAIAGAPHFAPLLPFVKHSGKLRLLILTEDFFLAMQAAAALSAFHSVKKHTKEENAQWAELDELLEFEDDPVTPALPEDSLFLADTSFAAPDTAEEEAPRPQVQQKRNAVQLLCAQSDAVFYYSDGNLFHDELISYLAEAKQEQIFIHVRRSQLSREHIRRLCFEQGFRVVRLSPPSTAYQTALFREIARQLHLKLAEDADLPAVIARLRQLRGAQFSQADFRRLLLHASGKSGKQRALRTEDLVFTDELGEQTDALTQLDSLIGLEDVKRAVRQYVAEAAFDAKRVQSGLPSVLRHRNLAFAGAPGTCKSVTARLLAQALQEQNACSGVFIEAGREDLIGKFLGHTSHMVSDLFRRAKGGVLFIDEVGALVTGEQDNYAKEAVDALVRHMELNPETTVIFASYPAEIDCLLEMNAGLSSRIRRVVQFPSYDDAALCEILQLQAGQSGCLLPNGWRDAAMPFFAALRTQQGERFGNGREARRLLEGCIGRLALRVAAGEADLRRISMEDLREAMDELLTCRRQEKRTIGFSA